MSRFHATQTTQYKPLQNDNHPTHKGGAASNVVHGTSHTNNNTKLVTVKNTFYQGGHTKSSAGSIDLNGTHLTPAVGSSKIADRQSTILNQNKLSTHLLDHGYGATPQPQHNTRDTPASGKSVAGKEFCITNYYKAVKRRMTMTPSPQIVSPTPPKQAKQQLASSPTPKSATKSQSSASSKMRYSEGTRYDTSLGLLTKKFIDLLQDSEDGSVDLNLASITLHVQKRRIYDITNVLEGIGILEKKSKNNIQWKYGHSLVSLETSKQMMIEAEVLEQKENHLDDLIKCIREEFNSQFNNTTHAYITNQDLKNVDIFKDQTVIIIKAPPEAKLALPDAKLPREIHLKAEKGGEIDVFLCPDASPEVTQQTPCDPLLDDIKPLLTPIIEKYLSPRFRKESTTYPIRTAQRNLNKSLLGVAGADSAAPDATLQRPIIGKSTEMPHSGPTILLAPKDPTAELAQVATDASIYPPATQPQINVQSDVPDYSDLMQMASSLLSGCVPNAISPSLDDTNGVSNQCYSKPIKSESAGALVTPNIAINGLADLQNCHTVNNNTTAVNNDVKLTNLFSSPNMQHLHYSSKKSVRNALIGSELIFSPVNNLQAVENDFDAFSGFLAIEPPLDTEYNFSLNHTEGLCDLFDFDL